MKMQIKTAMRDFPGGSLAKTAFPMQGPELEFNPWSGS